MNCELLVALGTVGKNLPIEGISLKIIENLKKKAQNIENTRTYVEKL